LAVGVILVADILGLVPDASGPVLRGRATLCEAVALQSSSAILRGDTQSVTAAIKAVAERNPEILSAAIRGANGTLLLEVGDHSQHWKAPPGETSTITHVRVPILQNNVLWGTVEISFRPTSTIGWAWFRNPLVRLVTFVAIAAFFSFLSYLYKVLQYLDPSMVIPERVKAMLDTLAEGVLVLDREQRILLANEAFARSTGRKAEDLIGTPAGEIGWRATSGDAPAQDHPWREALARGTVRTGVALCLERADGRQTFSVNAAPIGSGSERVRGALVTFNDVTPIEQKNVQLRSMLEMLQKSRDEINRQNQELQTLAMTDPLTGCLNRRAFFSEFEVQCGGARRYNYSLSCVMVDVDHFKRVNDRHGHATGDQVLQHIAAILKSLVREIDLVSRYGGEEFCILLPHTDLAGASQAAERFRQAIESRPCGAISLTASLGVSVLGADIASPQELLNRADEALYAAKRAGRNRVHCWDAQTSAASASNVPSAPAASQSTPAEPVPASTGPQTSVIPFRAVTALLSVLAHRDKATAAHCTRVADLCVATGVGLLNPAQCFVLEVAALLHDIGKLGVPDSILLKPGPLDDEEWSLMRKHDRMGAEIIQSAFDSEELTRIVRTHHAWYGGTPTNPGMPVGEEIPLSARILSIADAYDAMISDRPYRKGCTREEAFTELRKYAGKQFDPALIERFIGVVSARIKSQPAKPSTFVEAQSIAGIQRELGRLAHALDVQDLSLLSAVAGRLSATARQDGLQDVARLAHELEQSASLHPDISDIVERINQLMTICMSASGGPSPSPAEPATEMLATPQS
jgi:diguanylate cyclase (GGDEF)-like protein/PAS domain S-box-containing protein/putative nucleotidyltransferase with HDIG domain